MTSIMLRGLGWGNALAGFDRKATVGHNLCMKFELPRCDRSITTQVQKLQYEVT